MAAASALSGGRSNAAPGCYLATRSQGESSQGLLPPPRPSHSYLTTPLFLPSLPSLLYLFVHPSLLPLLLLFILHSHRFLLKIIYLYRYIDIALSQLERNLKPFQKFTAFEPQNSDCCRRSPIHQHKSPQLLTGKENPFKENSDQRPQFSPPIPPPGLIMARKRSLSRDAVSRGSPRGKGRWEGRREDGKDWSGPGRAKGSSPGEALAAAGGTLALIAAPGTAQPAEKKSAAAGKGLRSRQENFVFPVPSVERSSEG